MMGQAKKRRTLGILGGMGPEATVLLFQQIIQKTPAQQDADHIPVVMYSLPQIPDRTRAILGDGPSPVPMVKRGLQVLENTPACCVLIPCNTVFSFYQEFKTATRLPVVHLIHTAAQRLRNTFPDAKRAAVLATTGTRKTGLYEQFLRRFDFKPVYPDAHTQEAVMREIYNIKAGRIESEATRRAAAGMLQEGADVVLLACTELSVIFDAVASIGPIFDALRALADAAVEIGLGQKSPQEYCI